MENLQLTLRVTVVSRRWPSGMARFQTAQRYLTPSSSRRGVKDSVLVVCWSFDPPLVDTVSIGVILPSRYHLEGDARVNKVVLHSTSGGGDKLANTTLTWFQGRATHRCCYMSNQFSCLLPPLVLLCPAQREAVVAESTLSNCNTLDGHRHPCPQLWFDTETGRCHDCSWHLLFSGRIHLLRGENQFCNKIKSNSSAQSFNRDESVIFKKVYQLLQLKNELLAEGTAHRCGIAHRCDLSVLDFSYSKSFMWSAMFAKQNLS